MLGLKIEVIHGPGDVQVSVGIEPLNELFPAAHSIQIMDALRKLGKDVSYCNIDSDQGHDAFLLPGHWMGDLVSGFLGRLTRGGAP